MAEYTGFDDCNGDEIWSDSIIGSDINGINLLEEHEISKADGEYGVSYGGMFVSLLSHATDYELGTSKPFVRKTIPSLEVMEKHVKD